MLQLICNSNLTFIIEGVKIIKKIILIVIGVSFLLMGCVEFTSKWKMVAGITNNSDKKPQTTIAPNLYEVTANQPYLITTEFFSQGNVNVQYPQIYGMEDSSKETAINSLIKNDLLQTQIEEPIELYQDDAHMEILTLDFKYQITMNTPELLSILYTGNSNIEGSAFPTSAVYAITIDTKNVTKLKLSNFITIDSDFVEKIKQSTDISNEAVKDGMDKKHLITEIINENNQTIIGGLLEEWAYYTFCVTPSSLIVSIAISHVGGDYALVEVPGQYIKNK